ncbi:hypothetical protein TNCV_4686441 [Trichonephila clavipes]|nr:hypothetical protein TNCV_4686441 [Trichonephila clavipes]
MVCEGRVFFWRPLSTEVVRPSPSPSPSLSPFLDQRPASLVFSYILLVGKRVPRGVKGCRGDSRWDHAITLKMQVQKARVMIHKNADS